MMDKPQPVQLSFLEQLPAELILDIFSEISTIPRDRQKAVLNVGKVSRILFPIARDYALMRPFFHLKRLDKVVRMYQKHTAVAGRVTALEITTIEKKFYLTCTCHHKNFMSPHKDLVLIEELLSCLPQVHTVMFGPGSMNDTVALQLLLFGPGKFTCGLHRGLMENQASAQFIRNSKAIAKLAKRLRVLELPTRSLPQWYSSAHNDFEVEWDISACTSLQHFIAPRETLISLCQPHLQFLGRLPTTLRKITITGFNWFLTELIHKLMVQRPQVTLPHLSTIEIWSQKHNPEFWWGDTKSKRDWKDVKRDAKAVKELCSQLKSLGVNVIVHYRLGPGTFAKQEIEKDRESALDEREYYSLEHRGAFTAWTELGQEAYQEWAEGAHKEYEEYKHWKEEARRNVREKSVMALLYKAGFDHDVEILSSCIDVSEDIWDSSSDDED